MTLFKTPHVVDRYSSSGYVNGDYQKGASSEVSFLGSVEPIEGQRNENEPVGREDIGSVRIFSDVQLLVSVQGTDQASDELKWEGRRWELIRDLNWSGQGLINHYEYLAEYRGLL